VADASGRIVRIWGISEDVTSRKAEEGRRRTPKLSWHRPSNWQGLEPGSWTCVRATTVCRSRATVFDLRTPTESSLCTGVFGLHTFLPPLPAAAQHPTHTLNLVPYCLQYVMLWVITWSIYSPLSPMSSPLRITLRELPTVRFQKVRNPHVGYLSCLRPSRFNAQSSQLKAVFLRIANWSAFPYGSAGAGRGVSG